MNNQKVAWLLTAAPYYWHPILSEFTRLFPQTILFTAKWSAFAKGYENLFTVEVVGNRQVLNLSSSTTGYGNNFMCLSPRIIGQLVKFRPDIIFTDGFCLWTVFTLLLKLMFRWYVVIVYDGSSPNVDYKNSRIRIFLRRLMARYVDACITNNKAGKDYLVNFLKIQENIVFVQPYLVPDNKALLHNSQHQKQSINNLIKESNQKHPIFLYVGQIIPRKGVRELLEACLILQNQGYCNYTLLIAGEGWQRHELENFSQSHNLGANVKWLGQVEYSDLGSYFQHTDVFVFPTYEDVWGMALTEAMVMGKAVIASKLAGSAELIVEEKNGYCFEPDNPEKLAELMKYFIEDPKQTIAMGLYSEKLMSQYTPETAAEFLSNVIKYTLNNHRELSAL
ncbi:MAG: glycosyltransferase family 4 protein [Scytonematopsis contorta HA4267-MV1]|jgi:glycosyltransferase involved in cell wall biosynthesis|nr:glycosyltransferase family 4 protein [Scytonematopsis contorta HA4267-MV1]